MNVEKSDLTKNKDFSELRSILKNITLYDILKVSLGTFSFIVFFNTLRILLMYIPFIDELKSLCLTVVGFTSVSILCGHFQESTTKKFLSAFISDWYKLSFKKHILIIIISLGTVWLLHLIDYLINYFKKPQKNYNIKQIVYGKNEV